MAVQIIAFPVVARQNTNDDSTAFGKWFLTPYWPETLNLRGLIERVAFSQSVYSRDIVEGVITKLTSKKLKDLCTFDILGRIETTKKTKTSASGKQYATYERILYPLTYEKPQP